MYSTPKQDLTVGWNELNRPQKRAQIAECTTGTTHDEQSRWLASRSVEWKAETFSASMNGETPMPVEKANEDKGAKR